MNERIRELAEKAGMTEGRFERYKGQDCNLKGYSMLPDEMEKFAELLVLECVTAVMDGTKEGDHYAMRIEQHFDNGPGGILYFGVEE